MVISYCSVLVCLRSLTKAGKFGFKIIKEGRREGKSRVFHKQHGLWLSCSEFSPSPRRGLRRDPPGR